MSKIRIPKSQVQVLKLFCNRFARDLEATHNIRLRGNHLLNLIASAIGHEHYQGLLIDSGTYGDGPINWGAIPKSAVDHLHLILGVQKHELLQVLAQALDATINTTSDSVCDVDFTDVIDQQKFQHLNLSVLGSSTDARDRESLIKAITHQMKSPSLMNQVSPDDYADCYELMLGEFAVGKGMLGEAIAGKRTPQALLDIVDEIEGLIEPTKERITPTFQGAFDLMRFANAMYGQIKNTNGFSSADLAGWLMDNCRRLRLALVLFDYGSGCR